MKTPNFVLLYYFLFLSVNILAQTISNHLKEVPEGKFELNNPRILQKSDYKSYIIITYNREVIYGSGFYCYYRRDVSKIIYQNKEYSNTDFLYIKANTNVEIHFNGPVSSLQCFFDSVHCENQDHNVDFMNSVDLSNFDSSSLKDVSHMFQYCSKLKYINFQNFHTSGVTNMESMFEHCNSLESLDLSSFDVSKVKYMKRMFYMCESFILLNLSNFNTPSLSDTEEIFSGCYNLELLDISNFNFSNVTSHGNMFTGVSYIKYISISTTFDLIGGTMFNSKEYLIACQKKNIIQNPRAIYGCCDFSKSPFKCDYNNYITVKYRNKVKYDYASFINPLIPGRQNVYFIINQDYLYHNFNEFTIEEGRTIDILIFPNPTTLEQFFDADYDINAKSIDYVDLSHLNSSLITSTKRLFNGCIQLAEINFTNFKTSSIENMAEMFSGCTNGFRILDLSSFDTSLVKNMYKMFYNCSNFDYLDISNFNTSNLVNYTSMFNLTNIKYINLYNISKNSPLIKAISEASNFWVKQQLTVCQKNEIINNKEALYECCDVTDFDFDIYQKCFPDNYITVKFKKEVKYPYGFSYVEFDYKNNYRSEVYYIKYNNEKYKPYENLTVSKDTEIRILFNSVITSTSKFFYDYFDPNVEHIISIDFSHFKSSLIESAESMFSGCSSLETIDFSNFNSGSLKNMNNIFFHCNSLKIIDLSKLNTSSLININRMFCGCTSLLYLNLSGLDFSKVEDASYMFYNVKSLKLVNIYDIKYNDNFKNEINNISKLNDNNIVVRQKENIITNINYKYIDYNLDINEYECKNFMLVYYNQTTEYKSGFLVSGINSRNNLLFIINENKFYYINEELNINSNIKLCFKNYVTNLEKFFDASIDKNAKKIISIDLSHFDSSLVTNINNLFSDCQELLALNLSNFNSKNIKTSNALFNNSKKLKYIELYNITNLNNGVINKLINQSLLVCQSNMILQSKNHKYICCDFNLELELCHSNNYITAKYGSNINYRYGFKHLFDHNKEHIGRKGVNYIIKGNTMFLGNEPILIKENETIEIHLYPNTSSLSYFFYDQYVEPLISVDLSHFDSSLVTDLGWMFFKSPVKEINFTNFNTSLVTNMTYMFNGSKNLESLDLSSFQTSKVSSMRSMFGYCENLKYLNISNFDFYLIYQKFSDPDADFEYGDYDIFLSHIIRNNIKYLNLYNATYYNFFTNGTFQITFNGGNNFILNQKNNIFSPPNAVHIYCDTSKSPMNCNSYNYIIVKYKNNVNYTSGFINNNCASRKRIRYIIYLDSLIENLDGLLKVPFIIEANTPLEIHFTENINNLESFFDGDFDINSRSIIYVDLSHFNSTPYNVNKMFHNCPSLEYIEMPNFNTYQLSENYNMLDNPNNLKYINLKGVSNQNMMLKILSSNFKDENNLIICQNYLITYHQIDDCLSFSDTSIKSDSDNFIKIKFNKKVEYKSGFKIDKCPSRKYISYIIYQNLIFINNDSLIIDANKSLEIHFTKDITSLESFFNDELDTNSKYIISIDFSHFNSSLIKNIDNMFYKCTSLNSLDISNFDFGKINSTNNTKSLLAGLVNIKNINISNVKNYNILKNIILENSNLKTKSDLTICQNEEIIKNENATNVCPYLYQKSSNYIIIYYGTNVVYENGFIFNGVDANEYRKNIKFINVDNKTFYPSNYVEIKSGSKVEINLIPSIGSLAHFFDSNYDINMKKVSSIDFTNYNSSLITDINSLFKDCDSLESIIFSTFNSSLVNNMSEVFSGCSNLKEIDLSMLDTKFVIDMHNLFYGCSNLILIDLYNFKFDRIITSYNMFKNLKNIQYINLLYVENSYNNISESELNRKKNLFVCQKENIMNENNIKNKCCYYNIKNSFCESDHYMILTYGKKINYDSGFVIKNEKNTEFRNDIIFVVINRKKIEKNEKLIILPNIRIEIYFQYYNAALENFFNFNFDKNVKYLEKFSAFNIQAHNISHLFNGCSSLNSVDFNLFDSSGVIDMSYMFSECKSLISLNLSNFNTENTINMSHMFYGCDNLEILDISNFKFTKCNSFNNMFSNYSHLKYLNIKNINTDTIFKDYFNNTQLFYVCQSMIIIRNLNAFNCCDYNIEINKCGTSNDLTEEIEEIYLPDDEASSIILIGFSDFRNFTSYFSFYAYFTPIQNYIYSITINFQIELTYDTNMRILKEIDATCNLTGILNSFNYKYLCEVYEDTTNLKSIRISGISQGNMDKVGTTPIANRLMKNLLLCDEKYDKFNSINNIYLMNNSTYDRYDRLLFNITGLINSNKPRLENKNISLISNVISEEKSETEIDCIINNISNQNYILNCKLKEPLKIDLQYSLSFIDDSNILIINFPNGTNFNVETENKISYNRKFIKKQTGLSKGAIAAIIIISVAVFALIIFLIIYFRKRNIEKFEQNSNSSSNIKIKN